MTQAVYMLGDTRQVLATLPDNSVDLILTSPPFLALRSYLPADHPDKALEIGSEPTPGEFIDALLDVVEECRRVLAPHGSICIELGDTYSGSGGAGGDYNAGGLHESQPRFRQQRVTPDLRLQGNAATYGQNDGVVAIAGGNGWPEAKSLTLVPELFRLALAYGRNPLTGRETPRWRVRNVIRWCRPNPPVSALSDKFRPATSDMVIACIARDRYFDLDAVREPPRSDGGGRDRILSSSHPAGAPPLDYWVIPTQPYEGSHYATWPEQLCVRPIKTMVPQRVCTTCGQPSRRIVEKSEEYASVGRSWPDVSDGRGKAAKRERNGHSAQPPGANIQSADYITVGWTDCGHGTWRNGVVLDPFAGSGTTLAVATGHGRDAIGIDLDARNADLATQRIGPLLCTIDDRRPAQDGAA